MAVHIETSSELDTVVSWRRRQLLGSGFPASLAQDVAADRRFDVHALIELAERGCPPGLAVRILAPIEGWAG